jgi:hypothetical protein
MTGREKLEAALAHRDTAPPFDLGTTAVTGMHASVVEGLRRHYGLEQHPVKIHEPYQMLGFVEEDLKHAMGIEVDGIYPAATMFGFPAENWKEWRTPWGQEVLVPGEFTVAYDDAGACYIYPQGDTAVPPSGKMPEGSYFFDALIRQPELTEEELDPADNLQEFAPLSAEDLDYFEREAASLAGGDRGVIANFGGTGVGDIALVPALNLKQPKGIRDIEEWYISTLTRQDYLHEVFDRQTDIAVENLRRVYERVGDVPQAVFICGTDLGTQDSTFCSAETFDELYKPYYKKMNDWIHANTSWKTFKHTDGAVFDFIPHFIDAGFDILNPIQISATGMQPRRLKEAFGDRIVFWGAGVDSQYTLPFGTPQEVREEVLRHCETLAPGGGFVFNTIHNIQAGTPPANVVAMVEALHEFNGA